MILLTSNVILDYDGTPVLNGPEPPPVCPACAAKMEDMRKPITVRDAIHIALNSWMPGETPTDAQKADAFGLSVAAFSAAELELTEGEATFLEQRAGVILSVLLRGRLLALIAAARLGSTVVPDGQGSPT